MSAPIIGIGTARSGTKSLAHLLSEQGLDVTHEGTTSVPWAMDKPSRYGRLKRDLEGRDGDVSCWLTQAAPRLLEETEGKVLALKRPREDTVESLREHMGRQRIRADKPFGPMIFPTYKERPIGEAWAQYWRDYRTRLAALVSAYPDRVLCVETYSLETEKTQDAIAEHLGLTDWSYLTDCHLNER